MRDVSIFTAAEVAHTVRTGPTASADGETWWPARPLGYPSFRYRLKAAWLVFTGRADAVTWPMHAEQEGGGNG